MAKSRKTAGIALTEAQKKSMMEEIHAFYLDEYGEDIGVIKETRILDFVLEELAPVIYNKALDDARHWHSQQMENLENDYYLLYRDER